MAAKFYEESLCEAAERTSARIICTITERPCTYQRFCTTKKDYVHTAASLRCMFRRRMQNV